MERWAQEQELSDSLALAREVVDRLPEDPNAAVDEAAELGRRSRGGTPMLSLVGTAVTPLCPRPVLSVLFNCEPSRASMPGAGRDAGAAPVMD